MECFGQAFPEGACLITEFLCPLVVVRYFIMLSQAGELENVLHGLDEVGGRPTRRKKELRLLALNSDFGGPCVVVIARCGCRYEFNEVCKRAKSFLTEPLSKLTPRSRSLG